MPGVIVHHKIHLTRDNINDMDIALGMDNLEYLCRECHALEHTEQLATDINLIFDDDGNIIERSQYGYRDIHS